MDRRGGEKGCRGRERKNGEKVAMKIMRRKGRKERGKEGIRKKGIM